MVEGHLRTRNATNLTPRSSQVADAQPDAVIVIGFDESARILTSMIEKGIGPSDIPGVRHRRQGMGNALAEQFDDLSQIAGMKGTTPLTDLSSDSPARLDEIGPNLGDYNYAGESYDAVVITALARTSPAPTSPRRSPPRSTASLATARCAPPTPTASALIEDGTDIDYDGITGPLSFGDAGEPSRRASVSSCSGTTASTTPRPPSSSPRSDLSTSTV